MNRKDIAKKDVAREVKRLQKNRKDESIRFHRGHFPPGTVVVFESPRLKHLPESERKYPGQTHETFTTTVIGVKANGHDSYVAVIDQHCDLTGGPDSINIAWAREILKRGEGDVNLNFDPRGEKKIRQLNIRAQHPYDRDSKRSYNKHSSKYYIEDLRTFILFTLNEDVRYKDPAGDHLYDLDHITREVAAHPTLVAASTVGSWFTTWTVNKKKFHKILRAAVNKGRTSRIWAQAEDYIADAMMYEEEMRREMERDYPDLGDDEDDHFDPNENSELFNQMVYGDSVEMNDHAEDDIRTHIDPLDMAEADRNAEDLPKEKTLGDLMREFMDKEPVMVIPIDTEEDSVSSVLMELVQKPTNSEPK